MTFNKFVSKDEIKNYSIEKFTEKFLIEKENDVLKRILFKKTKILGFDTESKPTFISRSFFTCLPNPIFY